MWNSRHSVSTLWEAGGGGLDFRFVNCLTNHIPSCCNRRFFKSFLGYNQKDHLCFQNHLISLPCILFFSISAFHWLSTKGLWHRLGLYWYLQNSPWKPTNISGAMRLPSASQVHPMANRACAWTWPHAGLHCQHSYCKGHQIQNRLSSVSAPS